MRSPASQRSGGRPSTGGGTPGSARRASPGAGPSGGALPSPRSASAAKRARYSQRGSLASAGGTELLRTPHLAADEEAGDGAAGGAALDDVEEEPEEEEAEEEAAAEEDAAEAGGEQSPVPSDAAVALLRRRLLRGEGDVELGPKLQRNYDQLVSMFNDTLGGSQNNSVLLLGPRGVGKTLVLRRALAHMAALHGDTLVPVRLSGLLHADERTALREVARQLGAPPAAEGDDGDDAAGADGAKPRGSVSDNMALMAQHLRTLEGSRRAALFVLEEFDLFAAAHKQMLVYNLMDALQACSVRAAVVGVSVRTDAAELLEKRVRSRFSHRRLVFEPEGDAQLLRRMLALPPAFPHAEFAAAWNQGLDAAMRDAAAARALGDALSWDRAPRAVASVAMLALAALPPRAPCLTAAALAEAATSLHRDGLAQQLRGCTVCELQLLVACKRLQRLRERPTLNFAAAFEEYEHSLVPASGSTFARDVALRAFESLVALGVLEPAEGAAAAGADGFAGGGIGAGGGRGGSSWLKEYANYALLLSDTEVEQTVKAHPHAPPNLAVLLRHEAMGATGALQA